VVVVTQPQPFYVNPQPQQPIYGMPAPNQPFYGQPNPYGQPPGFAPQPTGYGQPANPGYYGQPQVPTGTAHHQQGGYNNYQNYPTS